MSKITKLVLERPIAAFVCVLALLIFGISSVVGMPLELFPNTTYPMLFVTTTYPQAGPEEVERLVTEKIEDGCGTLPGLKQMTSTSSENESDVTFQFAYGTSMADARNNLQEALEEVKMDLPDGVKSPTIVSMSMNAEASMTISVDSDTNENLLNEVKQKIVPDLKKIGDAADIKYYGGEDKYISVELYPEYVQQYGLDISAISDMISSVNFTTAAGQVKYGDKNISVDSGIEYKDISDLKNIPIVLKSGSVIHLSDVANIHYGTENPTYYSRFDGKDNISINICKKQSSNAVELSKNVNKTLTELREKYPDLNIQVVYDASQSIVSSIKSIAQTLVLGVVLSMLVIFLFFGDLKGSLIVGSSMPISLLVTFILMNALGFTLNMITMSALVIGIGMMVDNAIVVIEMCFRKRDEGVDFKEAAYEGTKIVTNSIIASTITSVVVYLPLARLGGMSGQMYGPLGYTIVFALLASLISALTLIPLCFSKYRPKERKELPINHVLAYISEKYGVFMKKALHRKKMVAFISILLFLSAIVSAKFIRTELMEQSDEKQIAVTMTFRQGTNMERMDESAKKIEDFVSKSTEISNYSTTVSTDTSTATVSAYVDKKCKSTTQEIVNEWNQKLKDYDTNCDIKAESTDSDGMSESVQENTKQIVMQGADLETLKQASKQMEEEVRKIDGVLNVATSLSQTGYKAEIQIDPDKAQSRGFTAQQLADLVSASVSGKKAMDMTVGDSKYGVKVELPLEYKENINQVNELNFLNSEGVSVPLSEMATIGYRDTPQNISRKNGRYIASVTATMNAKNVYKTEDTIDKASKEISIPDGIELGGSMEDESMDEEFTGLGKAIFTAVFLVFMVMAIQFESLRYSGLVMFCIPFSLIGAVYMMLATRSKLSTTSLMGFLMLAGIVVNNGILFIDTTNQYRKQMHAEDALILAGKSRLRPILMTTLTTILSMIPMCFGSGDNGQVMKGMAAVIIGGLTASTILTFILLPSLYMIIHNYGKKRKRLG